MSPDRDELLLLSILDRPNGDILNIVQAARELPGDMYDRLSKAYMEITRGPLTEAEANEGIALAVTYDHDEFLAAQEEEFQEEEEDRNT